MRLPRTPGQLAVWLPGAAWLDWGLGLVYTHTVNPSALRELLHRLREQEIAVEDVLSELQQLPFRDLDFARVDHHRALRQGMPEVIFAQQKTAVQVIAIAQEILRNQCNCLITRLVPDKASQVFAAIPDLRYDELAQAAWQVVAETPRQLPAPVLILTAGTSDANVAAEAKLTLQVCGIPCELVQDVGVAGLQRLLAELPRLRRAPAVIVIAGMEGALASVVGGLVACPVIAVPTSVGYGAAFEGVAALLGMMTSCAAGISVVNIDNGFGAAMAVARLVTTQARNDTRGADV